MLAPDRTVVRELRTLDPALGVRMTRLEVAKDQWDWRWCIYYRSHNTGRSYRVHIVEEPREPGEKIGAFRPLDSRMLLDLKRIDAYNRGSKVIMDEMTAVNDALEEGADRETEALAQAMAKEYRRLFSGHPLIQSGWQAPN